MWSYDKRLQFPVKIKNPDPAAAKIVITQLGGANGKRRYFSGAFHPRQAAAFGGWRLRQNLRPNEVRFYGNT